MASTKRVGSMMTMTGTAQQAAHTSLYLFVFSHPARLTAQTRCSTSSAHTWALGTSYASATSLLKLTHLSLERTLASMAASRFATSLLPGS